MQSVSSNSVFLTWRMSPSLSMIILLLPDSQVQTTTKSSPAHHTKLLTDMTFFPACAVGPTTQVSSRLGSHSLPDGPLQEPSPVSPLSTTAMTLNLRSGHVTSSTASESLEKQVSNFPQRPFSLQTLSCPLFYLLICETPSPPLAFRPETLPLS